jgi:mono/diheme cytochrome c family protein
MFNNHKRNQRWGVWFMTTSLVALLSACNQPTTIISTQKLESTLESIQRDFVNPNCIQCHTQATENNRYVKLTDLSAVIEKTGHDHSSPHVRYLIKPGCPKQSFFLSIIRAGKMPPSGKVSAEEIQTIETFIKNLDPNAKKKCDDEPPDLD